MPMIRGNDLVMIIQAVDHMIDVLKKELDEASPDAEDTAGLCELLFSYEKTSWHLEEAYQEALKEQINLPPYEKLVRKRG
ncbi:MAG: hypothetical protein ACJ763_20120 [Bdellovibrionia bacterium]